MSRSLSEALHLPGVGPETATEECVVRVGCRADARPGACVPAEAMSMLGMGATPRLLPTGGKAAGSMDLRAQGRTPPPRRRGHRRRSAGWASGRRACGTRPAFPPSRFRPARSTARAVGRCPSAALRDRWTMGAPGVALTRARRRSAAQFPAEGRPYGRPGVPVHFMLFCQGRRGCSFSAWGAEAFSGRALRISTGNSRWRRRRERTTPSGSR